MSAILLASNTFTFNDGNAGHVCNLGSAPAIGDLDVLCVNSNTVVSTPSGFTAGETAVGGQGAYIFYRFAVGGEGSTVTVTTSGDHETAVSWSRWDACIAIDTSTSTQANSSAGNATPAHSTGVMAETDELVVAFGALHGIGIAGQNTPVWSAGFTPLTAAGPQGTGDSGVLAYVGYTLNGGTAAETPQVSWSGTPVDDRYMLTVTFTTEADTHQLVGAAASTFGASGDLLVVHQLSGDATSTFGANGDLNVPTTSSYDMVAQLSAALLECLCDATAINPNPPQHCCYRVGTEPVHDISLEGVDLCCEGLAYLLLRDVYPSVDSFPDNDIIRQANQRCVPPAWAVALRIGVVRCVPTISDCTLNNEAFTQNLWDMQAINSAVCCFRDYFQAQTMFLGMSLVIERQTQGSTSGGCTERYVNMVVQIPNRDCGC